MNDKYLCDNDWLLANRGRRVSLNILSKQDLFNMDIEYGKSRFGLTGGGFKDWDLYVDKEFKGEIFVCGKTTYIEVSEGYIMCDNCYNFKLLEVK